MDKRKCKPFMICDKTDKIANNDARIGKRVDLASQLGPALSTLNTNVKNHASSERSYIQWGTVFKQQKSLRHSLVKKLETVIAACFKQACASNASVDGNIQVDGLQNTAYLCAQRVCWLDLQI